MVARVLAPRVFDSSLLCVLIRKTLEPHYVYTVYTVRNIYYYASIYVYYTCLPAICIKKIKI